MRGKFVCSFVCLSYLSGTFCVAWLRTLTAAFESIGLGYMCPHLTPHFPHGQSEGV